MRPGGATHRTKRRQRDGKPGHRASKVSSRRESSPLTHRGPRRHAVWPGVPVLPGSKTQANRHEGSPGTWEVCRLPRVRESVRVSPNSKAPGSPGVRLELEGAKHKARRGYCPANAMSRRDGRQKSECPRSTSAAGEPSQGSPSRGRRAPCHRPVGGKHG